MSKEKYIQYRKLWSKIGLMIALFVQVQIYLEL